MKQITKFLLLFAFLGLIACSAKDDAEPQVSVVAPKLSTLSFDVGGQSFLTSIVDSTVTLSTPLPFGTTVVTVKSLEFPLGCTCVYGVGTKLSVSSTPIAIKVIGSDKVTAINYKLTFTVASYVPVVTEHGQLSISGTKIVDKNGVAVSFAGLSLFWSNWGGSFYNKDLIAYLKNEWKCNLVRAAMGIQGNDSGKGYLDNKAVEKLKIKTVVDACIAEGIYVIIDWHSHYAHLPNQETEAIAFFKEMATAYKDYPNIIYEIYNEPLRIDETAANANNFATWNAHIKPYSEKVIAAIRAIDTKNIIVVGTGEWSQKVDDAAANPIVGYSNIAYALHFYSPGHAQWLRERATAALAKGLPIFVTEWGSKGYTTTDLETEQWMLWCKTNQISHCNWAVNSKAEPWSIVIQGTSPLGNWSETDITEAGKLTRSILAGWEVVKK